MPLELRPLPILDAGYKACPHTLYDTLRNAGGIEQVRLPSGAPVWFVTRYEWACSLLRDPRLSKAASQAGEAPPRPLQRHLLAMDPPDHTAWREVLAPLFSAARFRAEAPAMEALADALLSPCVAHEPPFDLLARFALPFAFTVVCDQVGVPAEGRVELQCELDALDRAEFESAAQSDAVMTRLHESIRAWTVDGFDAPRGSLVAALRAPAREGRLATAQIPALVFLVLAAGRETAANFIANATLRLLSEPAGLQAVPTGRSALAAFVEELLRLETPLETATARRALADIVIGGVKVAAGDTVFIGLSAANHDPRAFAEPMALRPERRGARHLAFGHGVHKCLGIALARVEGQVALQALARRMPGLRLAAPEAAPAWRPGLISRGLQHLMVRAAGLGAVADAR